MAAIDTEYIAPFAPFTSFDPYAFLNDDCSNVFTTTDGIGLDAWMTDYGMYTLSAFAFETMETDFLFLL